MSAGEGHNSNKNIVTIADRLSLSMANMDMAFKAKPTYNIEKTYETSVKKMHNEVAFLDTGGRVNRIRSALTLPKWRSTIMEDALSRIWSAAKHPLQIEGLIMLQIRLGDFCTWVWIGIARQLAANVLLATAFKAVARSMLLEPLQFWPGFWLARILTACECYGTTFFLTEKCCWWSRLWTS